MDTYKNSRHVNIPYSKTHYKNGHGETVWVDFQNDALEAYKNDEFGIFEGTLLNSTHIFPDLKAGHTLKIEFRGKKKPVAVYNEISSLPINKNAILQGGFQVHRLPDQLFEALQQS
jgi:hypothetical protein